jgi:hypothetical protein
MIGLIEHLERHLGNIEAGWKDSDGSRWPFYVLRFTGGPIAHTHTYSTLGLADIPLMSPVSGKEIRHELLFMARASWGDRTLPALLHQVGMEAVSRGFPYLRGEVIGRRGRLFPDTQMEALYVSGPVYLPDSFAAHKSPEGIGCIFAWLIPITACEAEFVRNKGWNAFEDLLCQCDPDLLDFKRASIAP